jgi:hypothetical protein
MQRVPALPGFQNEGNALREALDIVKTAATGTWFPAEHKFGGNFQDFFLRGIHDSSNAMLAQQATAVEV